jgi:basic membrane protein A and related proteins
MPRISRRTFHRLAAGSLVAAATRLAFGQMLGQSPSRPASVALLLSGSITDGGWGQLAFEGLRDLAHSGYKTAYAEDISLAQMQQVGRGYADDGFDLIIGHGFEFSSAMMDIAPDYPAQKFFVTSYLPQSAIPPNILFVDLEFFDAAYAAGALAALVSEKKIAVGYVGGEDDPTQQRMRRAFIAGAQRTLPGLKGLAIITGDYDNAAKGKEAAATLIGNGCDVIWHAADVTGLGAIQGAAAAGAKVIGCYSDQTDLAPDRIVTSFEMNLRGMVKTTSEAVASSTFAGGRQWPRSVDQMWLLKCGVHGDHNPHLVSPAAWAAFQRIWSDLAARRINVAELIP